MYSKLFKNFFTLLVIIFLSLIIYQNYTGVILSIYHRFFPCRQPIYYTIGSFDTRFGISEESFLKAAEKAENIWEEPYGRQLFAYTGAKSKSSVLINLIYDYRQEATTKIKSVGAVVAKTRSSYDEMKRKYDSVQNKYLKLKAEYDAKAASFKQREKAYQQEVNYWNSKGGAPKEKYDQLSAESRELKQDYAEIKDMEKELNNAVSEVNALVKVLNDLAKELNIDVSILNTISHERGEEFTQGEYAENGSGREINVYEFSTTQKLTALLGHEFGHALGLGHVENPASVMYRLNENETGKLTVDDFQALQVLCGAE